MLRWKIVDRVKASVIYIYIYIDNSPSPPLPPPPPPPPFHFSHLRSLFSPPPPQKKGNPNPNPNIQSLSKNGVGSIRREHIVCSSVDEQCNHHRREGFEWMLERDHLHSSSIWCPIQARSWHAKQHQEDCQPQRPCC